MLQDTEVRGDGGGVGDGKMPLFAISLTQPWATMVAIGAKKLETRSFQPSRRHIGHLCCIHAAKNWSGSDEAHFWEGRFFKYLSKAGYHVPQDLPHGKIIAVAPLLGAYKVMGIAGRDKLVMVHTRAEKPGGPVSFPVPGELDDELYFGDFSLGRSVWKFGPAIEIEHIPIAGNRGTWALPADAAHMVIRELARSAWAEGPMYLDRVTTNPAHIANSGMTLGGLYSTHRSGGRNDEE